MSVVNLPPMMKTIINELDKRIRKLEQSTLFQAPSLTADPAVLRNGMIWYRSDLNTFRVYQAGAVKTITVS